MKTHLALAALLALSSCSNSSDNNAPAPDAGPTADDGTPDATSDAAGDSGDPDATTEPDLPTSFCATADCAAETPVCSELLMRCVECTSNNDCATAPNFTCETMGDGMGGDPLYECVECVDDSVCAGGTCDPATHTCVL